MPNFEWVRLLYFRLNDESQTSFYTDSRQQCGAMWYEMHCLQFSLELVLGPAEVYVLLLNLGNRSWRNVELEIQTKQLVEGFICLFFSDPVIIIIKITYDARQTKKLCCIIQLQTSFVGKKVFKIVFLRLPFDMFS